MQNKLKTTLFILLLIPLINQVKAQSITDLDRKQGFYGLNINDSYQKWSQHLELFSDRGPQKSYFYKSKDVLNFFNYPVSKVLVTFNNQKLISITIDLGIWNAPKNGSFTDIGKSLEEFENLLKIFKSQYGNHTEYNSDLDNGKVTVFWEAKTHYLLSKLSYLGISKGSRVSIDFGDKNQIL